MELTHEARFDSVKRLFFFVVILLLLYELWILGKELNYRRLLYELIQFIASRLADSHDTMLRDVVEQVFSLLKMPKAYANTFERRVVNHMLGSIAITYAYGTECQTTIDYDQGLAQTCRIFKAGIDKVHIWDQTTFFLVTEGANGTSAFAPIIKMKLKARGKNEKFVMCEVSGQSSLNMQLLLGDIEGNTRWLPKGS